MGNCFKKNLYHKFDNDTQIYRICSDSEKAKSKVMKITLEGDIYTLCPDKHPSSGKLIETDEIYGLKDGLLTFLKDSSGIKTGQHCIKNCFFQILQNASNKNHKNMVFSEPKVSDENKTKLFKNLVTAIYIFDKRKPKQKYVLKKIYIPWSGISESIMDELLEESIFSMTVLVD